MNNLHQQFVQLGRERNKVTRQLLALLPEIFQKKIYLKYAATIEEYAGKFAGLSKSVVQKRLRLEKNLIDKPALRAVIAEAGVHKVALIAKIATIENERFLAEKVVNMSKSAVQELSKELRDKSKMSNDHEEVQSSFEGFLHGDKQEVTKMKIELDSEMMFLFLKLKKKFGKDLSNKDGLKRMLKKLAETELKSDLALKIRNEAKNEKPEKALGCEPKMGSKIVSENPKTLPGDTFAKSQALVQKKQNRKPASRYIPAPIKKSALRSTNCLCAYRNCHKPAEVFHHPERFALTKNHNHIQPLCKVHHEFAHNGLIESENSFEFIDSKYRICRRNV